MEGIVKWFNRKKGYGFIQGEDEKDYFVHYTDIPQGVFLHDNDPVTFELAETERGMQAKNVVVKDNAEQAEKPSEEEKKEE